MYDTKEQPTNPPIHPPSIHYPKERKVGLMRNSHKFDKNAGRKEKRRRSSNALTKILNKTRKIGARRSLREEEAATSDEASSST
jgi:hypothetical protein